MYNFVRKGRWLELQLSKQEEGHTLEEVLRTTMGISGRMLQRLTRRRGIELNGRQGYLAATIKSGDRLRVSLFERESYGLEPEPVSFDVLYEDDHLLVVNKPAGIAVHPTDPNQTGTLAHGIAFHYQLEGLETKVRHVHRLDKDTSGLLLVAKHELAHALLDEQLRERKITRQYLALTNGKFVQQKGTIDHPIGRDRHHPTRRRVSSGGDPAITYFEVMEQYDQGTLVRLELETGRTHQIRVHLSYLGNPIIGDRLYGGSQFGGIRRQALHAERLIFTHPFSKEEIEISAPLPADMEKVVQMLKM